jgi:hypothetical protein
MHYQETQYGFEYGAVDVSRMCSDEKKGWVVIRLKSPRGEVQVYVTKTGKMTVHERVITKNGQRSSGYRG